MTSIHGAVGRPPLVTISLSVAFGLMIGIPYGVLSGYFGGWTDTVGMRVVDGALAFPDSYCIC